MLGDFWFGISLPFRALRWIASDLKLTLLSLFPAILTLVLYVFLWRLLMGTLEEQIARAFMAWGWNPRGFGADAVLWLSRLMLMLTGAWSFSFCAAILSLPFLDFLAERAETVVPPGLPPVPSAGWKTRAVWLSRDVVKTLVLVAVAAVALVLSWIPLLNLLSFALTCLLITLQYVSYPQSRRGHGWAESMHFLLTELPASLGFGLALSILFAIPGVSALTLPLAVVGGTALFARRSATKVRQVSIRSHRLG